MKMKMSFKGSKFSGQFGQCLSLPAVENQQL